MKTSASTRFRSLPLNASKILERRFVASVATNKPTVEKLQRAEKLVTRVRTARSADFLNKYRLTEIA